MWVALMDWQPEHFRQRTLAEKRPAEVYGGRALSAQDAFWIAREGTVGQCYDPAVQVEHGGLRSYVNDVPFYVHAHGPTVPAEQCRVTGDAAYEKDASQAFPDPTYDTLVPTLPLPPRSIMREVEAEEARRTRKLAALLGREEALL
eukprot:gene1136-1424_t